MKRLPITFITLCLVLGLSAKSKKTREDYPRAELKVSYDYRNQFVRGEEGIIDRVIPMLLLVNSTSSKYYNPTTESKDSLQSTPSGRAKDNQILSALVKRYLDGDKSAMDGYAYKTQLYVFKDRSKEAVTVYDYAGMTEYGKYSEPMSEMVWQICDSAKTVLGYECIMATTDYHGRKWTAWFSPEIPVPDGPWKFQGLPGLILEASEPSGVHVFTATGLEQSDMEMVPMIYTYHNYDSMPRLEMLRSLRQYRDHGNSMTHASIGLDLGPDTPLTQEQMKYDFLETDYR